MQCNPINSIKINTSFSPSFIQEMLLEFLFALDEEEELDDGTKARITLLVDMLKRWLQFDESHHPLDNSHDVSGPRAGTLIHSELSRGGARSCRSFHHVTGGYGVTMAGEPIPPLYIFTSKAAEGNEQVNVKWVETHGFIRGKWGNDTYKNIKPWVAATKEGSINNKLFMAYVEECTFEMFPEETVSLEVERDDHGRLIKGPVLWMMDAATNRTVANAAKTPEWDEWAKDMYSRGVLIYLLLPNATSVLAVMDELFRAYKADCRIFAQKVFAQKLQKNAREVAELKKEHAARRAVGETIPPEELRKVNTVVKLEPEDVGKICFGELTEDGMPAPDSPFAKHFTKEKILRAAKKVCQI